MEASKSWAGFAQQPPWIPRERMSLLVDPVVFFQQTVNFLILLFILHRILYKPVRSFLDERTAAIESEIKHAEKRNEEAAELRSRLETELAESKNTAREYMENAERRSEQMRERLLDEARTEADQIRRRTKEELEQEREKVKAELRQQAADLSLLIAGRIVRETMDEDKQGDLVDDILTRLENNELGDRL